MNGIFSIQKNRMTNGVCKDTAVYYTEDSLRAALIVQKKIMERLNVKLEIIPWEEIEGQRRKNVILILNNSIVDVELLKMGLGFPERYQEVGEEGYKIGTFRKDECNYVIAAGNGRRGIIHGTGALLRHFRYYDDRIDIPWTWVNSAPVHSFRASLTCPHKQDMGYKWWTPGQWEEYFDELQLWGANVGMYIPLQFGQRDADIWKEGSIHAKCWEPMRRLPEIIKSKDMEVGIYLGINDVFPSDAKDFDMAAGGEDEYYMPKIYTEEACICPSGKKAYDLILKRREELFSRLKYLDYVYVPTTDYGGCACEKCSPYLLKTYIPLCKDISEVLKKIYPDAKFILSTQFVNPEGMKNVIFPIYASKEGEWADMLCYGSHYSGLSEIFANLPSDRQKIVVYPEMTMIDNWGGYGYGSFIRNYNYELGYGMYPENAEFGHPPKGLPGGFFDPRESAGFDMKTMGAAIFGSFTYSEGLHDDLTKIVWLSNNWSPGVDSYQIALDYCRFYFGEEAAPDMLKLVKKLEERSVRRMYAIRKRMDWYVPVNAYVGEGYTELVNEIIETAVKVEGLLLDWSRDNWRWKLIKLRVIFEQIGLAIEQSVSERKIMELRNEAIELARVIYVDACVTTISRISPLDTLESIAVKPEWNEETNRREMDLMIKDARDYKRLLKDGKKFDYFVRFEVEKMAYD